MTAQPLLQFGTVALDPAPDGRVVRFQVALAEQFFDIAERERIPKVPAYGAQNQLGIGLSPLEDRRSDCLLHDLFRLPAAVGQSCNTTAATDSVHQQRVRGGGMRRSQADSTNRSLAAFGKLQHIRTAGQCRAGPPVRFGVCKQPLYGPGAVSPGRPHRNSL